MKLLTDLRHLTKNIFKKEKVSIMNFEKLTKEENKEVNDLFNTLDKHFKKGIMTNLETEFIFTRKIIERFGNEKAFQICTNRKEFTK